jgi:hypothetical protein
VTHDEVADLVPAYALGALEADVDVVELEEHLRGCAQCSDLLATCLDAAAALGEAVEPAAPPPALRAAVFEHAASVAASRRRWSWSSWLLGRSSLAAVSILLVLSLGLGAGYIAQQRQLGEAQTTLALDERGLALLTSTETSIDRLAPLTPSPTNAHGHWYHRPGVDTQVVVVEFMPAPPATEAYYGWLEHNDGSWQLVGRFTLDASGYGRIILLGGDGSNVRGVTVTRQAQSSAVPSGEMVLRWPSS